MNNEPVAWIYERKDGVRFLNWKTWKDCETCNGEFTPLYTHPHPDNLGLAESIIKQQELRIANLEKELKRTKFAWNLAENELETLKYEKSSGVYDSAKTLTDEDLLESLAELEHEQWAQWASAIIACENISNKRIERWNKCMIPYANLSEEMKEFDREWARKALAILRKAQEK